MTLKHLLVSFSLFLSFNLIGQTHWVATAGTVTTFSVSDGDRFYDPSDGNNGGPGGNCLNSLPDPANYPNCNCTTVTTLCAIDTIVLTITSFGVVDSDWLKIYDGPGTGSPIIFNNDDLGDEDGITQFDELVIVGSTGCLTFESFFSSFTNRCGWEAEICVGGDCIQEKGGVAISDGASTQVDTSAILDLQSNKGGLLLPRMSEGQRLLIPEPKEGLLVFDKSDHLPYFRTNSQWKSIGEKVWSKVSGNAGYSEGFVGIGHFGPKSDLHVYRNDPSANGRDGVIMTLQNLSSNGMSGIRLIEGSPNDIEEQGAGLFYMKDKFYLSLTDGFFDTVSVDQAKMILGEDDLTFTNRGTFTSFDPLNIHFDDFRNSSNDYNVNLRFGNTGLEGYQSMIRCYEASSTNYMEFSLNEGLDSVGTADWVQQLTHDGVVIQGDVSNGNNAAFSVKGRFTTTTLLMDGDDIDSSPNRPLHIQRYSNGSLYMAEGGGNVTIGSPLGTTSKLEVRGPENSGLSGALRIESGTQYMLFDGNEIDTYSSNVGLFLNNNSSEDVILVDGGGLVGINDDAPSAMLHIKQKGSGEEGLAIENDSDNDTRSFEVGGNNLNVYFNGSNVAIIDDFDGSWDQQSDARLKKDINYLTEPIMDRVMALRPANYRYLRNPDHSKKSIGFIAQEVQQLFPQLVNSDEGEYLSLSYSEFSVIAIKAIQEQQEQIDDIKEFNELLMKQNQEFIDVVKTLEKRLKKQESESNK